MRRLPLLLLPLALAACDGGSGNSTSISIDVDGDDNSSLRVENGVAALKGDDFSAKFRIPGVNLKAEDFDINGVKLYPKSQISGVHVSGSDNKGKVDLDFTSPAALATVQDWFRDKFTAKGFKFSPKGDGFAGTTEDGDAFTLDLSSKGADSTRGHIQVSGS